MQAVVGSTTSSMQMQRQLCKALMNGFADASECVYGRVGNFNVPVSVISLNAESRHGEPINGVTRVRDTRQWQVAL